MAAELLRPVLEQSGPEVPEASVLLNKFYLQLSVGCVRTCVCVCVCALPPPPGTEQRGVPLWPPWPLPCSAHKDVNRTGPDLEWGLKLSDRRRAGREGPSSPPNESCPLCRVRGIWQEQKACCFSPTREWCGKLPPKMSPSRSPGSMNIVPYVAKGTVQLGFSERSGDGFGVVLMDPCGP